jgi:transcriptional regulator with XRE-family HTH domain
MIPAGQVLKRYRIAHNLKQKELAERLGVEPRTLARYESGESPLRNIDELLRIAMLLGIDPEEFGIKTPTLVQRTPEQIDEALNQIWSLVGKARNYEARLMVGNLIRDLNAQITDEDHSLLRRLAQAHHVAGYVISLNTHTTEVYKATQHFEEMEKIARILKDDTLLNLAFTYHGDMLRREGDLLQALTYLEAARDTTPLADKAARGNGIQLLGRAYVQVKDINNFERSLAEAEQLVYEIDPEASSTHSLYCPGTVYEEYGRSYGLLGEMNKALKYLDRAEKVLPDTTRWQILLMTTRTISLVRGGEFRAGGELAVEAARLCRIHGNIRCLERLYGVQHYLERLTRDIGQISTSIREALDGPIGHWDLTN